MASLNVGVITPDETQKFTMQVPDDVPVQDLREAMVENMGLPSRGQYGERMRYHLNIRNPEGKLERLDDRDTLEQSEVQDGDVLQLTVEMVEGDNGKFAFDFESLTKRLDVLDQIVTSQVEMGDEIVGLKQTVEDLLDALDIFSAQLQEKDIISSSPPPDNVVHSPFPEVNFLDFDLVFSLLSDDAPYQACATWYRETHRIDGKHVFPMPVSLQDLEYKYLLYMGIVARGSPSSGVQTRDGLARELGGKLFNAVFSGTVRDCFTQCQSYARENGLGIRIRLHLNDTPELMNYPWEFLWNEEDDFLANSKYTPIARYQRSAIPPRRLKLPEHEAMRMLVFTASPQGSLSLNIKAERLGLTNALQGIVGQGLLEIEWLEHATPAKLRRALNTKGGPHILHYIGHGGVDDKIGGYLCMEGEDTPQEFLSGGKLGMWLRSCHNLQLVVLNACRGARTKADDPFSNIASEIVRAQVPAVVAMQHEISDQAAIKFSDAFYRCMAHGWSIYEAMGDTRQELYRENDIEWMIPVLYSRSPDGILFKRSILSEDDTIS